MTFQMGDRVEHKRRGRGTFLMYGDFSDESIVQFDQDSDAEGETLCVTTMLLSRIDEKEKLEKYEQTLKQIAFYKISNQDDLQSIIQNLQQLAKDILSEKENTIQS